MYKQYKKLFGFYEVIEESGLVPGIIPEDFFDEIEESGISEVFNWFFFKHLPLLIEDNMLVYESGRFILKILHILLDPKLKDPFEKELLEIAGRVFIMITESTPENELDRFMEVIESEYTLKQLCDNPYFRRGSMNCIGIRKMLGVESKISRYGMIEVE